MVGTVWGATNTEAILDVVQKTQVQLATDGSKYQQVQKMTLDVGTFRVDEYVMPDGTPGYQVIYFDQYDRVMGSDGFGPESKERTFTIDLPPYEISVTSSQP